MFSDAFRRIERKLFHFLFTFYFTCFIIKDKSQRLVFLIFGAGNVPPLQKPGS